MNADATRYHDEAATSTITGLSRRTLQRMRAEGGGPLYVRLGLRRIAYPEDALTAWANARTFPHRAAELARKGA